MTYAFYRRLPALLLLGAISGCTDASTSVLAPDVDKCAGQVAATSPNTRFPAVGGAGTIAVNAARDCTWAVASDSSWIAVDAPAAGQGEATVSYRVTANATPNSRRGAVTLASQRIDIAQDGAPCRFSLDRAEVNVPAAGGPVPVRVSTLNGCAWNVAAPVEWIAVTRGASGSGPGDVTLAVALNAGPARVAQINVGDAVIRIVQAAAASPVPAPSPAPPTPAPPPAPSPGPAPAPPAPAPPAPAPAPPPEPRPPTPPPPPTPPAPAPAPEPVRRVELSGRVSDLSGRCPDRAFTIDSTRVLTSGSTEYRRGSCDALAPGGHVELRGVLYTDGMVRADRIELRRGEGDDDDDDN